MEAHRNQPAFAPWETSILASSPSFGRLEPGTGIAPQYRSGTHYWQFSKAALASQFLAECLIADDRWHALVLPPPVGINEPCPNVATGAQDPVAAVGLAAADAQSNG